MSAIDRLTEIDVAASPGPWSVFKLGLGDRHGADDFVVAGADGGNLLRNWGTSRSMKKEGANATLAYLSHLLLPAYRALDKSICTHEEAEVSTHAGECFDDGVECAGRPCSRCAALNALDQALDPARRREL